MSTNWWCFGERGIVGVKRIKHMQHRNVAPHTRLVVHLLHCWFIIQPKPIVFFFCCCCFKRSLFLFYFEFWRYEERKEGGLLGFGEKVFRLFAHRTQQCPHAAKRRIVVWVQFRGFTSIVLLILIWLPSCCFFSYLKRK